MEISLNNWMKVCMSYLLLWMKDWKFLWIEPFLRLFSIPFSLKMKTSIISKIGIIFSMRLFSFMQHGTCYSRCQLKYLNFAIASKDGRILLYSHCNIFCIRQHFLITIVFGKEMNKMIQYTKEYQHYVYKYSFSITV